MGEGDERIEWEALVAVDSWTSAPERFAALSKIYLAGEGSKPSFLEVERVRLHKGRPVVKFFGVSDISAAEALAGRELRVPESELESLPEGRFYQFQVRGLTVKDRVRGEIGVVESVLETGGTDLLVVRGKDGEETLVPLCDEIVKNINPAEGSVDIDAPEGLVSLNAN